MSVLNFDKVLLGNLEYSLQREMLATNRSGGYMSTTIVGCNTRKYHGLVVVPVDGLGTDHNYVLLSSIDETILHDGQAFNLAVHRFPGVYEPRGHKYITDFRYTPCPALTYEVGGCKLRKEILWIHDRAQLMVRYTLEGGVPVTLRLRPMLAFRDAHTVGRANMWANGRAWPIEGGVRCRMYDGFPWLNMQTDRGAEFVAAPDWYYNFEYLEEQRRGYPFAEDLLTPGYFEFTMQAGESVTMCCKVGDRGCSVHDIPGEFEAELSRRSDKNDFSSCLRHSGRQFIARRGGRTEAIAGFPWFGSWGRDTFIALPGITLTQGGLESCTEVIDTMIREMRGGLFPNVGEAYNSVDAPLWFFWTLQQLAEVVGKEKVWADYGEVMTSILDAFLAFPAEGAISVREGLVWASQAGRALTWMDAVVEGVPVTGRDGFQVEINALWYNALRFVGEFSEKYVSHADAAREAFLEKFWLLEEGYLADYVGTEGANTFIRPNQIIACSLPYIMLTDEQVLGVFETVGQHLLTPRGLRTLSPRNALYQGRYEGDQPTRDRQYHQGTVWPWLLEHYAAAGFRIYGEEFKDTARELIAGFEEDINSYGIGSIPEIYDGDPPHTQRGAISQAWSVGAVLRIKQMIER